MKKNTNTHNEVTAELIKAIFEKRDPLTHLIAGTSLGKTFHTTNTDKNILFVAPLNTIKAQTTVKGGENYNIKTLLEAFKSEAPLRGVVSANALLQAYISYTLTETNLASFHYYIRQAVDSVVLDEIHLYITEAIYRPELGELYTILKEIKVPVLTLTATPIESMLNEGVIHEVTTTKTNITDVTILTLPIDAGTKEVSKELTKKAYAKTGRTDGELLENGKYQITDTKKIKTPTGFAPAQKLNTLSLIVEEYLDDDNKGLIILSDESKIVTREIANRLNKKYPTLNMVVLDRDIYDLGLKAKAEIEELIRLDLAPDTALKEVYSNYPILSLYDEAQLLNRPIIMTKFGSAGMNILDDVENAIIVMLSGTVIRNISNETKLQVSGRMRKAKNNKIYDIVSIRSLVPEAKRNTAQLINKLGIIAVSNASPFKSGVNTILNAKTSRPFQKSCLDYLDSFGQITIASIVKLWESKTDTVNIVDLPPVLEGFETQAGNITKQVLKVVQGKATYPKLEELYKEVMTTNVNNKLIIDPIAVIKSKTDVISKYFPLIKKLVLLEVFDSLSATWAEQFSHLKETGDLLNPIVKWSEIVRYKVRNAYDEVVVQKEIENVISQLTPMTISRPSETQLNMIAEVLPKPYAKVILSNAKFTEKKEIINIWISGKNVTKAGRKYYDFNEFVTLEDINEKVLFECDFLVVEPKIMLKEEAEKEEIVEAKLKIYIDVANDDTISQDTKDSFKQKLSKETKEFQIRVSELITPSLIVEVKPSELEQLEAELTNASSPEEYQDAQAALMEYLS